MGKAPAHKVNTSLPPERAFVVQLEAGSDLSGEEIEGRVEHVVSGHATRFHSLAQLVAFLRHSLDTAGELARGAAPPAAPVRPKKPGGENE